jgi:hypothetical protein
MPGLGIQDWWQSAQAAAANYSIGAWLFLRALGVVYALAFLSLTVQIKGLAGRDGILPARNFSNKRARHTAGAASSESQPSAGSTAAIISCSSSVGPAHSLERS